MRIEVYVEQIFPVIYRQREVPLVSDRGIGGREWSQHFIRLRRILQFLKNFFLRIGFLLVEKIMEYVVS